MHSSMEVVGVRFFLDMSNEMIIRTCLPDSIITPEHFVIYPLLVVLGMMIDTNMMVKNMVWVLRGYGVKYF